MTDLVEVPGAGHAPSMEQPAPVTAAIRALVEQTSRKLNHQGEDEDV